MLCGLVVAEAAERVAAVGGADQATFPQSPQVDVYASGRSAVSTHVRQPVSRCMTLALFSLPVPLAAT